MTSMSELSTVAIKDGHRGHLPHQHTQAPSGLSNQLDAERADRISRLAGLERSARPLRAAITWAGTRTDVFHEPRATGPIWG